MAFIPAPNVIPPPEADRESFFCLFSACRQNQKDSGQARMTSLTIHYSLTHIIHEIKGGYSI
ncbi:MAG: hypothetical protein A2Y66_05920 [Nitrospirae bacterium RBG_13_41_22]|nr:MAG: hypothetical protein A2Y66_05920 [Nitrospirae bacterium RBG_13_41_22]